MKIFCLNLIKDFPCGYDCYLSVIVLADNEDEARQLANSDTQGGDEHSMNQDCWLNPEITECHEIYVGGASMVILKSPSLPKDVFEE